MHACNPSTHEVGETGVSEKVMVIFDYIMSTRPFELPKTVSKREERKKKIEGY